MKRFLLLSLVVIAIQQVNAQTVGISDVTFTPSTKAVLDLSSDRRGFLPPRLPLNGNDLPISGTKPAGLIVFNSGGAIGSDGLYYWTGSAWTQISTASNSIGGSGTLNYVPKFTPDGSTIGNSTIFDNGNVGINTTSPATKLTVKGGSSSATLTDYTQAISDKHGLMLSSGFSDGAYSPGLFWNTDNDNPTKPKAGIFLQMTNAGSKMILGTSTDYPTGLTNTAMAIDDLGKVGVGTLTPVSLLHVYDASDSRITVSRVGAPATHSVWRYNSGVVEFGALASDGLGFLTGGVGRMYIATAGNVGIATNTPTELLDVNGKIRMRSGAAAGYVPVSDANGAMTWTDPATLTTSDDGDWTISGVNQYSTVSGNVGIGTSAPASKLVVTGDVTLGALGVDNGVASYNLSVYSGASTINTGNGRELYITAGTSDNNATKRGGHLYLRPGIPQSPATTYGTVIIADQGGNVGVGTSTANAKLEVASTDMRISSATDAKIQLYGSGGNRGHMGWVAGSGIELWNTDNSFIKFATTNTERMRIDAAGNVGIGGSTSAKLHITGNGGVDDYLRLDYAGAGRYSTIAHTGSGMLFKVSNNGDLFYWQNAGGTNLMAINPSTTNVGVGIVSPGAKLEVLGSNSDTPGTHQFRVGSNFGFRVDASTGQYLIMEGNNSGSWSNGIAINRVAGNVGIGTTNSTYKLHVYGDTRFGTGSNRFAYISSLGAYTGVFSNNGLMNLMDLRNYDGSAAGYGTAIQFQSGDGTNPYPSGKIASVTEGAWSSTASTRDAYLSFQTALNGNLNERMRIASNGNVGIGITDPIGRAHVGGNFVVQTQYGTYGTPGATYDALDVWGLLYSNNQDAGISILAQNSSDYALWQGRFAMKSNSGGSPRIAIEFNNRNTSNVVTSSVEAISIPSNGYVGLGTDAPSQKLHVHNGHILVGNTGGSLYSTGVGNIRGYIQAVEGSEYGGAGYSAAGLIIASSGGEAIAFKNGGVSGTTYMTITGAGRVGIGVSPSYKLDLPNNSSADQGWVRAYGHATYSDKRLKTNVADLNYGLDAVMKLRPVSYYHHNSEFKDGSLQLSKEGANTFGLLAQEAYEVIPEMVNKPVDENSDLWSVDYSKLGPVLVKALQEQQAQIERLEKEIQVLKKEQEK